MVRCCLFFLMLFIALPLLGQRNCDAPRLPFSHPEKELPIFDKSAKNDFEKLFEFIFDNLKYPETVLSDKPIGQGFIEFWIDTNGFTSEHKIIQSVREDLDEEFLRVYKLIKFDVPAKNYYDEPMGMCYQLPFRFTLADSAKSMRNSNNRRRK